MIAKVALELERHKFSGESQPLTELREPVLREAYDYWCRRRGARSMPAREDIAPEDMKSYLPRVLLIDVRRDPLDFVYRVFGSGVAQAYGKEFTGRSARDLKPAGFAALIWRQYLEVVETRAPRLHWVLLALGGNYLRYQRVTLPLSDDGETVDKLLAVSIENGDFWKTVAGVAPRTRTTPPG
ncbi:MAG TPA: PAS domain-containing protein [Stellaceae bacterium]|nr:PAS domain-containing protein [Stellaceae bacterium]